MHVIPYIPQKKKHVSTKREREREREIDKSTGNLSGIIYADHNYEECK